jgi:hypothetical protein
MRMTVAMALLLLAVPAGSLDSRAEPAQSQGGVIGDQRGGRMQYGLGGMPGAMEAATAHCRSFGKKAMVTQMVPEPDGGGRISFECRGRAG